MELVASPEYLAFVEYHFEVADSTTVDGQQSDAVAEPQVVEASAAVGIAEAIPRN